MKVLLVNGSPHKDGCTAAALAQVAVGLGSLGVDSEVFWIGREPVRGCIACGGCRKAGKCVFEDDPANALADRIAGADGVVIGSPVYYAGPNGALTALLDRAFYSRSADFAGKPGASVVSCRRGGASAAFDRLNKYFTISRMPVISSCYWNSVHGNTAQQAAQDLEGMQVMRELGKNMACWLEFKAGRGTPAVDQPKAVTNFIR